MATILEAGPFASLIVTTFVFIFVLIVGYALLTKVKFFGDNKGLNGLVAFIMALLFIVVPGVKNVVVLFTPWITLFMVLLLVFFVLFMFLGAKESEVADVFKKNATVLTIVIATVVILFLIAMAKVYGPFLAVDQQPGFWNTFKRVIFNPKVLGALFIIIVASYAVRFIGSNE